MTNTSVVVSTVNGIIPFNRNLFRPASVLATSAFIVCAYWPGRPNH